MAKLNKISEANGTTSLDVVFVHGLDGDPFKTWTHKGACFWPEWLKEDFAEADIWSVGYDATSTKWGKETLSFYHRARDIDFCLKAEGVGNRSICFVCHSLGGLLIKQILMNSATSKGAGNSGEIIDNTKCVVFFATPHRGSKLANLLIKLNILNIFRLNKLVNYLRDDIDPIENLYYFYRTDTRISTLSFYETEQTPLIDFFLYFKSIPILKHLLCPHVVPEASADCGKDRPISIDENHFNICKFSCKSNPYYKKILKFLRESTTKEGLLSVPDSPSDIFIKNKPDQLIKELLKEINNSIKDGRWANAAMQINNCEVLLDENILLPNRSEIYTDLAEEEINRIEGLYKTNNKRKDYSKVQILINKAKQTDGK